MVSFSSAFSTAALLAVVNNAEAASSSSSFTPTRIRYEDLVGGRSSLLDALSGSSGIVSLTDLPGGFSALRKEVLSDLHPCIADHTDDGDDEDDDDSIAVQRFPDGTVRRSLATATTASDGPLKLRGNDRDVKSASCRSFRKNLDGFRSVAREATDAFAAALSRELEPHLEKPLLRVRGDDPTRVYDTVLDLVRNGEQLEHFHSYVKKTEEEKAKTAGGEEYRDDDHPTRMETIDVHADQGFFIAFTPGMMVSSSSSSSSSKENDDAVSAGGFFIVEEDSKDGAPVHVDFDVDVDDLVFMLGDGVNQYVNDRFHDDGEGSRRRLRATPHAVSLKAQVDGDDLARVWYGRMVLPPDDALVAPGITQTTLTFGDVRRRLAETSSDDRVPAGLGCSSPTARALQHSGSEDASACAKDTLLCWARCMELSEHDITEDICAERNLQVKCINPRGQFQTGERHGDFWPACTNTTIELTPYPEIPQTPEEIDTTPSWEAFLAEDVDVEGVEGVVSYDHSFNLTNENNKGVMLQWSVVDEEKGIVRGRLAFNDVFGWLSIGFADPEGKHNGMNGADILLALPGGNYTPMYGLEVPGRTLPGTDEISVEISKKKSLMIDSTVNPEGATVHEYLINPEGSSFRHWYEPTRTDRSGDMSVVVTDYATALTWETDGINGKKFDTTGADFDDMIWGGNSKDYHVGYHGRGNRARFHVNWKTGEAKLWKKPEDEEEDGGHDHDHESEDDHESDDDSAAAAGRSAGFLASFAAIVAVAMVIF